MQLLRPRLESIARYHNYSAAESCVAFEGANDAELCLHNIHELNYLFYLVNHPRFDLDPRLGDGLHASVSLWRSNLVLLLTIMTSTPPEDLLSQ